MRDPTATSHARLRRTAVLAALFVLACLGAALATIIGNSNGLRFSSNASSTADLVLDPAGRLGVCTLAPQGNLHVAGNLVLTGAGEATGYVLSCDASGAGTWVWSKLLPGADPWLTSAGNVTIASGMVGLGTSAPSANLHVAGNLVLPDLNPAAGLYLTCDANGMATWGSLPGTPDPWSISSGNIVYTAGWVGIGTVAPAAALQVASGNLLVSGGDLYARRGANPARIEVHNAWTSSSNYERFVLDWKTTASSLLIGTQKGTTGGNGRDVVFVHGGNAAAVWGGYKENGWAGLGMHTGTPGARASWLGHGCRATGDYAIAVGYEAAATGTFSVALGANTFSSYDGRVSLSNGAGPVEGPNFQSGMQGLSALTTDATPTPLSVPTTGGSTHTACTLAAGSSISISGVVLALAQNNTQSAGFEVQAAWQNNAGTLTMLGNTVTQLSNNGNAWSLVPSADDANDRWTLTVTGAASTNVTWTGMFTVSEAAH